MSADAPQWEREGRERVWRYWHPSYHLRGRNSHVVTPLEHESCEEWARRLAAFNRPLPGEAVTCPRCGAPADKPCLTESRWQPREPHAVRVRAAIAGIEAELGAQS